MQWDRVLLKIGMGKIIKANPFDSCHLINRLIREVFNLLRGEGNSGEIIKVSGVRGICKRRDRRIY